jgi:hypothetical protein
MRHGHHAFCVANRPAIGLTAECCATMGRTVLVSFQRVATTNRTGMPATAAARFAASTSPRNAAVRRAHPRRSKIAGVSANVQRRRLSCDTRRLEVKPPSSGYRRAQPLPGDGWLFLSEPNSYPLATQPREMSRNEPRRDKTERADFPNETTRDGTRRDEVRWCRSSPRFRTPSKINNLETKEAA